MSGFSSVQRTNRLPTAATDRHLGQVLRQYELVDRVLDYDPDADEALLNRAYVFSVNAHGTQKRASGDPYFSHPIEVAGILTDLHLDDETIATAILHDTVEDTVATTEEIKRLFGANVARLVDGVTKLSRIEAQTESERAAENLRKFLLAMSDDIRVLLVKLADRLHNMRTLHFIAKPEKRRRIARETMEIYAPLAERIGMYEFMKEMQTLAFRELEPEAFQSITKRLAQLNEGGGDRIARVASGLTLLLGRAGLDAQVSGREKHPYSIWRKMAERHINFEQMSDVMAFRVDRAERSRTATRALGVIHRRWPMRAGPVQGLHLHPQAQRLSLAPHQHRPGREHARIEIQIRTAGNACGGGVRRRRALGVQGGQGARPTASAGGSPTWSRSWTPPRLARGAARTYPHGDVPGPDLRLHPQGRADPVAQGGDRRSTSPMPSTPTWATKRWGPRSTAASCRCAPFSRTATRCRSSNPRRSCRSRTG